MADAAGKRGNIGEVGLVLFRPMDFDEIFHSALAEEFADLADIGGFESGAVERECEFAAVRVMKTNMAAFSAKVDESGTLQDGNGFGECHVVDLVRGHDLSPQLVRLAHGKRMNDFLCKAR